MPVFSYRALSASGHPEEATAAASSRQELVSSLSEKGYFVTWIEQHAVRSGRGGRWQWPGGRPGLDEIALVWREMSVLVAAGISLPACLAALRDQTANAQLRAALADCVDMVVQGHSLSAALSVNPKVFPRIVRDIVRTGESSGDLAVASRHLASYLEQTVEIRRKVKTATLYPAVVLTASVGTVIVLVTFILPRFMGLFDSLHVEVPTVTRLLLSLSQLASSRWYVSALAALACVALLRLAGRTPRGRALLDGLKLRLPAVGDIARKLLLWRIGSTLATGLKAGMPVLEVLEIAAESAGNSAYSVALLQAREAVASGEFLTDGLSRTRLFPPLFLQMVAAGEQTGELAQMFEQAAAFYHGEAHAKMAGLTSIIEPVLVIVMGIIVGFIAVSVISPIYTLVEKVGE